MKINYRDVLYRYSTGLGPNLASEVPTEAIKLSSYKMCSLKFPLGRQDFTVNVKREADRIAMQVEATMQMIKTLGTSYDAPQCFKVLKSQLDVINCLLLDTPLKYIRLRDFNHLCKIYLQRPSHFNAALKVVVDRNINTIGVHRLKDKSYSDKNMPLFDGFGKQLGDWDFNLLGIPGALVLVGAIWWFTKGR